MNFFQIKTKLDLSAIKTCFLNKKLLSQLKLFLPSFLVAVVAVSKFTLQIFVLLSQQIIIYERLCYL